ncbi:hypothetical protein EDD18DRAFT_1349419 [Armillaria luteobubalina]|uniref:Uncharacterized protein n=1 Tax=Armillaria luteobubalina TaxID=153913 RepID=A0AA39QDX9_9AGAR|nr:hypothetical protein EDD18DRAFT_1349419 [Armillaria luteobubalina]
MSPDSSSDKVQCMRGNRAMLSAGNGGCNTHISIRIAQLNPVPAVPRDNLSGDPSLGLITYVQRIPNDASSAGSNEAHTKPRDHEHSADSQAQVSNAKCV